jgi:tRNA(Arg) A34 adenosine deaminase TadA
MDTAALIGRFFDVIEDDIAPMTRRGVSAGNKVFGAAILLKSDLSLVIAETNNETENPLWHGEMHAIKKLYERDRATLPDPKDCLFLATHEPCSLCLSAITWAGYDNFYYLFSHEQSRDSFAIPHDLRILKEVFTLDPGGYNASNAFWQSHDIARMIAGLDRGNREALLGRLDDITALYADLSAIYQAQKGKAGIPLA